MSDKPAPTPGVVGAVFAYPSEHAQTTVLKIVRATTGASPDERRDDNQVARAIYNVQAKIIVNASSQSVFDRLDNIQGAMAVGVEDPEVAASMAVTMYREAGISAKVVSGSVADEGMPENFMYFVICEKSSCIHALLFVPINPDPSQLKGMSPPKPWKWSDK